MFKVERWLMAGIIVALLLNAAAGFWGAYEASQARRHSAENNCILRGLAETEPGRGAAQVARCGADEPDRH